MTVSIDIRCDNCRGKNVSIPIYGGDETAVDCEDCGAELGTLADIKTSGFAAGARPQNGSTAPPHAGELSRPSLHAR
jgi:hypothetical protein